MQFPLDFGLLGLWLATTGIILLITAVIISAYDGPATLTFDQRKLKIVARVIGILFLTSVAVRIYEIAQVI